MSDWQDKSDAEINDAIYNKKYGEPKSEFDHFFSAVQKPNYCNNPSDTWPIILENGICINAMAGGDFTLWYAHDKYHTNVDSAVYDENPLRAAMIVYLEMNGVKP